MLMHKVVWKNRDKKKQAVSEKKIIDPGSEDNKIDLL